MDYAGFFGKDPTFLNWVKELFLYYWDKGIRQGESHEVHQY